MRIFLTGATGFIGSRIIPELRDAGHDVLGLTRSDAGAEALIAAGAEPYFGTLEDPEELARAANQSDGVIHCAFDHDFTNFLANCEKDRRVIAAMGAALKGTDKPLIITSGTGMGSAAPGQMAFEDVINLDNPNPRAASEREGEALLAEGINLSVVRLPQVHDPVKQGLVTPYIMTARQKGVAAYIGDGLNRWPAAHVSDVARLYVKALARSEAGSRYHAVAEEGIAARDIAAAVGAGLNVPVISLAPAEAEGHFGWLGLFVGMDLPASSAQTKEKLGWVPTGPGLIADLEAMRYV